METRNFNTVNDLSDIKCENKGARYIEMAHEFAKEAERLAKDPEESFMIIMAAQEVISSWRKAESSDCEYTAYANAHSAEVWLEKMITRKF